jgi:hypothetical protein
MASWTVLANPGLGEVAFTSRFLPAFNGDIR